MPDPEEPDRRNPERRDRRVLTPRVGGRRATDPPAEWVSVSEFAARYGVDRSTVYKWLSGDILETYRVESLLRIRNLPPDQHAPRKPRPDQHAPRKPRAAVGSRRSARKL